MTTPWLSVVIPTYNGQKWLNDAFLGVCCQDGVQEIELLLIDDGSADETVRIAEQYVDRLPLKILCRSHSGNWTQSVNLGLQRARGTWACILHQDDVWKPGRLKALQAQLAQFPEGDVVLHPSEFIDTAGRVAGRWKCPLPVRSGYLEAEMVWSRLLVQNFVACCAPIFRTELAKTVGLLDEDLWYTADWDFWLKLTAGGRTLFCPETLLSVRIHPGSQTMKLAAGNGSLRGQYQKVLDRHLGLWESAHPSENRVSRRARYSADLNLALAGWAGGGPIPWRVLFWDFIGLGPVNAYVYLRDSGIFARGVCRLFALCGIQTVVGLGR